MGRWKAVRLNVAKEPDGPLELYDLTTDPDEEQNIADKHPDVVQQIRGLMKTVRTPSEQWPLP